MSYALVVDVFFTGGGSGDTTKQIYVKTYVSPWEKAMKGDEGLIATLKTTMPGPIEKRDMRKYKCFNRYFPQDLTWYCRFFVTNRLQQSSHIALLGSPCPTVASRRPTSS